MNNKIAVIVGTRPELIKLAPLIIALKKTPSIEVEVINSAQHKDLLDPYWPLFGLFPDLVLDIMRPNQSLAALTSRCILEIQQYFDEVTSKPDLMIAQGDTTTVMAASLVCLYNKTGFVHLEAGLRSHDLQNPYPEEMNRKVASIVSELHLAPTEGAQNNLLNEGIPGSKICIVGNTVVDSLNMIKNSDLFRAGGFHSQELQSLPDKKLVLITCHRRENQGKNLQNIIAAVNELANTFDNHCFVWPVHPNPNVKDMVLSSPLKDLDNVLLTQPLEYMDILKILQVAKLILTDSGGIQEEAPSFNVPVLVLRETTERPEGVDLGYAQLVGADKSNIVDKATQIIRDDTTYEMTNPYGDGLASLKSVARILDLLAHTH
jgi:UDP-N-acetylglucosamine 2-epimerase (non-hydrolysing)